MALVIIGALLLAVVMIGMPVVIFSAGFLLFALVLSPGVFYPLAAVGLAIIILGKAA